jgi:hypothetical protein
MDQNTQKTESVFDAETKKAFLTALLTFGTNLGQLVVKASELNLTIKAEGHEMRKAEHGFKLKLLELDLQVKTWEFEQRKGGKLPSPAATTKEK